MQYDTSDIRKGLKVVINNEPHVVTVFEFVKPGKGNAFTRTKLKNLVTGNVLDRTYKTGEKLEPADIADRDVQYLYQGADGHVFMDTENYEQYSVSAAVLGDVVNYLSEGLQVILNLFESRPLTVELPNFVELEVVEVGGGSKGDRATGDKKEATLATGFTLQVPVFVNVGDVLKVDTRTGQYVERVKK